MLSLHLLQVSLVYVNTLMIQQVLARARVAGPSHGGGPPGAVAAEVAARQSVRDVHPEHARAATAGAGAAVPWRDFAEISGFARLRPYTTQWRELPMVR